MKSNLRNEIKSYIVRQGMTMQEVVDLLRDEHGWSDSVSNLSNKLQRESLRYVEAVQLADALGYEIVWQKRKIRRIFHMTDTEKKLLQAQHRLEEAQARDRVKERKARTRRLIQEGAILEKVLPEVRTMELPALEEYLLHGSCRNTNLNFRWEVSGKPGAFLLFSPEGRTYSPPRRGGGISCGNRALCEANAAAAAASRQCHSTCGCCCHRLRRSAILSVAVKRGSILLPLLPPAANLPPAALFAAMTRCSTSGHFLFCERETEKERTR